MCELATNSERVLKAAGESFREVKEHVDPGRASLSLRFWVDRSDNAQPPWPSPYVRGLGHLVYAGFDARSSFLADLSTRRVVGRFSSAMASDPNHWKTTIFPMLMSIVGGSMGLVELHSACVAKDGSGVLLIGAGQSGKSTQAMALMRLGFRVLSDDRTFCSLREGKLLSYGLARPVKLRHDAGAWFEEFRTREPRDMQNGEPVFLWDANPIEANDKLEPCEPKVLILLDRQGDGCRIARMKRSEIRSRIEANLLPEITESVEGQDRVIDAVTSLPCWRLQCGARPEVIAEQIARLVPSLPQPASNPS